MTGSIAQRLRDSWSRSDEIFDLLDREALHEQPIGLRQPLVFYLGHLPAFAWNQVCRGVLELPSFRPDFDSLFERGIDPMGIDHYESTSAWPSVDEILQYRDRVRSALLDAIEPVAELADRDPLAERGRIFEVAIEHELMHQETLQYLFQQLPLEKKRRPATMAPYQFDGAAAPVTVEVGGGPVVLGADFDAIPFGWDNEFPELEMAVGDFGIDRTPVRNAEFLDFVKDGGYERQELWRDNDWQWRQRVGLDHPVFWSPDDGGWTYQTMFDSFALDRVSDWPIYASHAEALGLLPLAGRTAGDRGRVLPRRLHDTGRGRSAIPVGATSRRRRVTATSISGTGRRPRSAALRTETRPGASPSWWATGWEWTDTVFEPYPGFSAYIPSYPGYSADFFDGLHHVMLGASWATPTQLIRRSLRNWFQPHYPYLFAKFRCVYDR